MVIVNVLDGELPQSTPVAPKQLSLCRFGLHRGSGLFPGPLLFRGDHKIPLTPPLQIVESSQRTAAFFWPSMNVK